MSTRTRAVVHDVLPALLPEVFPGCGEKSPLEIPALSAKVAGAPTVPSTRHSGAFQIYTRNSSPTSVI